MELEARRPDRIFVVSIDSTREVDLAGRRIRRLQGVSAASPREGDREWRPFVAFEPDPPGAGVQLLIVWGTNADGSLRCTQTSQTVGAFLENPTVGPFAWLGDDESRYGVVLVDGESIVTATAAAAHTLAALANVGVVRRNFLSPEPLFGLEAGDHASELCLTAAGASLGVGPQGAVGQLYDALRGLPPCLQIPFGTIAASRPGGVWSTRSVRELDSAHQRIALRAAGLTDDEIASADLQDIVNAACDVEELLGSWSAVGRWLRSKHPATNGLSPLEMLAKGEDVTPALNDPFAGDGPPAATWEAEAITCYRAAVTAWTRAELRRTRHDGRWVVMGARQGVRVGVFDTLYGLQAWAQVNSDASDAEGMVSVDSVDPEGTPAQLAKIVDEWLEQPGHRKLALARTIHRVVGAT